MSTFKDIKFGNDQLYKIWSHVTGVESLQRDNPTSVNYKTQLTTRLHPVYTIDKGYLIKVEYYADHEDADSLILQVDVVYDDDARSRTTTRQYTTEHGDLGDYKKVGVKRYNARQWARVQIKRRQNVIEELTAQAETFGILEFVQDLWRALSSELTSYVNTGDQSLVQSVATYEGAWLESPSSVEGVTLRQAILAQLTFQV